MVSSPPRCWFRSDGRDRSTVAHLLSSRACETWRYRDLVSEKDTVASRNGDIAQALTAYLEHGHIHVAPDAFAAKHAVVDGWMIDVCRGARATRSSPRAVAERADAAGMVGV